MRHKWIPAAAGVAVAATSTVLLIHGSPAYQTSPSITTTIPANSPSHSAPQAIYPLHAVHDPGRVTGTITGPCHTRDGGQLPDRRCTPGAYDPAITAAVLCAPGYSTSAYRPPASATTRFKYGTAEPAYGQPGIKGELDHLIPLELGGANDASNLWVEAGRIPNPKDTVETRLHDEVCAGTITLRAAQLAIATDWMTAP